tara:strand:+ start:164 stop:328 length:165 start_codon:yes stop_codon:yes gene_type:complete
MGPNEENESEYEQSERCGDVSREEVEDDLVVEEERKELSGLLFFGAEEDDEWGW